MSRTDKDRPYWVKLNDDATGTNHDHRHLGKKYYRERLVRDSHGHLIIDEVEWGYTADQIIDGAFRVYSWSTRVYADREITVSKKLHKAIELHAAGRGDEFIVCGVESKKRTETVLYREIADHCTEGEKLHGRRWWDGSGKTEVTLPCTPEVTGIDWRKLYTSGKAGLKTSYSRERYGRERRNALETLGAMAKAWNSGYEVDGFDEELALTAQHRHSMAWDLY